MSDRKEFSEATIEGTLLQSARVCPLCYWMKGDTSAHWDGQIAHLDRNHSNNALENAVFLCGPCHNLYDARMGQYKQITPVELRHWRGKVFEGVASGKLPATGHVDMPVVHLRNVCHSDNAFATVQLANESPHSGFLTSVHIESAGHRYTWDGEEMLAPQQEFRRFKLDCVGHSTVTDGAAFSITVTDLDRSKPKIYSSLLMRARPLKG